MHPVLREAADAFQHVVLGCSGDPPGLRSTRIRGRLADSRIEFVAVFNNGHEYCWSVSEDLLHRYPIPTDALHAELPRLYEQMVEDVVVDRELRELRQHLRVSGSRALQCEIEDRERHVRRRHQERRRAQLRPPSTITAETIMRAVDELERIVGPMPVPRRSTRFGDFRPEIRQTDETDNLAEYRAQIHYGYLWSRSPARALFQEWDQSDSKAEARGLALLKEWLSPEQLALYKSKNYFEVVGGASSKRYRIKHGRQQNIFQLDRNGKEICGWCFLPEGGLVTGDVMLAQKIALETNEKAALKIANKFPASMDMLRPGAITWFDGF